MFDRINRSFELVRASVQLLRRDNQLLLFPAISGIALLLVLVAFALPVFGFDSIDGLGKPGRYSIAFLFYVVQYFVMFYFNVALVGAVMFRLDGGRPTLADGLRIANRRVGAILGYAIICATIGVILRAIQERVGFVGRLIVGLLGASWAVATFLVLPVLVERDRGVISAISESADLLKRTWGENLVGQTGLGAAFGLIYFGLAASALLLVLLVIPNANAIGPALVVALITIVAAAFFACFIAHATLSGIYSAVLYRYAMNASDARGFDADMLGSAFKRKS